MGGAFRPCDGPGSSQRDDPTSKSCRQAIPTVTCDPSTWPFALYKSGLSSGMKFTAEILDTWNMTVTPVDGVFELKKKDGYEFMDKEGRSIALPDRPYIALRLRLLQG